MLLLILFAFLAGIVTILSPCILPILPIVLSGSIGGGKRRPFGVVTGFILSFTFFILFLASIVNATGISPDFLRSFSIIVVFLFGLSLLSSQAQVLTERLFSKISGLLPFSGKGKSGLFGGFVIGLSLGLVWTPCVGPILASVISLALTGTVTGTAFFITFAYALGTAIPLLAITYGGRSLLQRVPWLLSRSGEIQKAFGVLMILAAIGIFFRVDRSFQTYITTAFPQYGVGLTKLEDNPAVRQALQLFNGGQVADDMTGKTTQDMMDRAMLAPELIPGGKWFNPPTPKASEGQVLKSLRGKVVLIDFWTYTCINCIRTLPYLREWHKKYAAKGLVIIGIHTPEFAFERDAQNVSQAIKDFNLQYSVMQDNDYATWRAYKNQYWPAKYFIDKNGVIRSTHFGEGDYDASEKMIQTLLKETGATVTDDIHNPSYTTEAQTPETYLGYDRLQYLASPESIVLNKETTFSIPNPLYLNTFAYQGKVVIGNEYAMPKKGAKLALHFDAKNVFLVMRPQKTGLQGKIRVYVDGKLIKKEYSEVDVKDGEVTVSIDRLYRLITLPESGSHTLELEFLDDNLEIFAFTFG